MTTALASLAAGVLATQEVDRGQPRSGGIDQAKLVAEAIGPADFRFEPALVGTPGGRWRAARAGEHGRTDEPTYGIALASRYPVMSWHCARLGAAPIKAPVLLPGGQGLLLLRDEPRVVLAAVIRTPVGALTVATTHLSFVPGWNVRQLRQVIHFLRTLPGPRILIGDLNLPGRVPAVVSRWRSLSDAPTYPAHAPRFRLDHALADGLSPSVGAAQAVQCGFSDHRALVLDLR